MDDVRALAALEALERVGGARLLAADHPARVGGRGVHPTLDVREQLGRGPGVGADAHHGGRRRHGGREVAAGDGPVGARVEAMDPGGVARGGGRARVLGARGDRCALAPGVGGPIEGHGRRVGRLGVVESQGRALHRGADRDRGEIEPDQSATQQVGTTLGGEDLGPGAVAERPGPALVQRVVRSGGERRHHRARVGAARGPVTLIGPARARALG